jgi:hypothetical protein
MQALSTARQRPERHLHKILRHTRGIIFLGTPHHGSGLALWAECLSKVIGLLKQTNPDILSVLQADSEVLARIQDSFHTMIRARNQDGLLPIEITCFFEEIPLPGVGLVSETILILISVFLSALGCTFSLRCPAWLYSYTHTAQSYGHDQIR